MAGSADTDLPRIPSNAVPLIGIVGPTASGKS